MPVLKLYYDLMSQPSRSVFMFLRLANVKFEKNIVDLKKGHHLTDDFKKISPFQKVPAIQDKDFTLTESIAIMKYISDKYSVSTTLMPKELYRKARAEEFFHWYHLNLRVNAALYFRTLFIDPRLMGKPADVDKAKRFRKSLEGNLQLLERYFLVHQDAARSGKPSTFLCGNEDGVSAMDLLAMCELMQTSLVDFDVSKEDQRWPGVAAWMRRVRSLTEPHFSEAHKIIFLVQERTRLGQL